MNDRTRNFLGRFCRTCTDPAPARVDTYEKIIEDLGKAITIAAQRPEPGNKPIHISSVRASAFFEDVRQEEVRVVTTLPPGWLPPKEVQPLIIAVHKIIDRTPPSHVTAAMYEVAKLAHDLVDSLRRSETCVQQVISGGVVREIWPTVVAQRVEALTTEIDRQSWRLAATEEQRKTLSRKHDLLQARVKSLLAIRKSGIVPADPRDLPSTPARRHDRHDRTHRKDL